MITLFKSLLHLVQVKQVIIVTPPADKAGRRKTSKKT
jgi:hypothetical protein